MHILLLPSWYPSSHQPLAGIFLREQFQALSQTGDMYLSIIDWGPNEYVLKIRHPWQAIRNLCCCLFAKQTILTMSDYATEYHLPHLTWSSYLNKGNYQKLADRIVVLIREISKSQPPIDLIHAHVAFPAGFVANLIARKTGIPFLITEHSGPFPFPEYIRRGKLRNIVREPLANAAVMVAVSTFLANQLSPYLAKPPLVIPNLVDTDFFRPPENPLVNSDQIRLFTLSAFSPAKGLEDLIRAIALSEQRHRIILKIGGEGKLLTRYRHLAIQLGVSEQIKWLGKLSREQAKAEYQQCDIYVMPSRIESFSIVVIEAMACGKPILATDCGGPADLVNQETGVLAQPANPANLALNLDLLIGSYQDYDSFLIRNNTISKFSKLVVTKQIYKLYQQILM